MSHENLFEQHEPLIYQSKNLNDMSNSIEDMPIEDQSQHKSYEYNFKLNDQDRELDITVNDNSVVIVASANERSPEQHSENAKSLPPLQLSSMLTIPDDAETSTVKVSLIAGMLNVSFARGEKINPDRKLYVQAD